MLARLIFLFAGGLLLLKVFAPQRLRAFGKQIDRVVNATLIALGIVYSAQLLIWLFSSR